MADAAVAVASLSFPADGQDGAATAWTHVYISYSNNDSRGFSNITSYIFQT